MPSAGLRTVPLVTLLGSVCALLTPAAGGWILAAGLLAVAGATAMGNAARLRDPQPHPGITTISLFGALAGDTRLQHVATRQYPSGLVQGEYRIAS